MADRHDHIPCHDFAGEGSLKAGYLPSAADRVTVLSGQPEVAGGFIAAADSCVVPCQNRVA
ncbi:hypothetical protein GCM10010924_03490 [Rhizobium wenxiniae]|nr:hypothetical protein GCM10010924_03490 [Rhizobium wenxiniae]